MGRLFAKCAVGIIAGLFSWMIMEPSAPKPTNMDKWGNWEAYFVLLMGSLIGLAVGGLDGYTRGGKRHTTMGASLGLFFGAIGLSFGHSLGGTLALALFGHTAFAETFGALSALPPRFIAFTIMGICLGGAIGGSSLTVKRTIQGAIGGAIGGAIAGLFFDPISIVIAPMILGAKGQAQGEVGGPGRALFAVLLGGGIALFIGLVERYSRSAWLRLSLGRNEGKEWSIDTAQTFIGRSEGAQVPLFGDPNIAPVHASIQRQDQNYVLIDAGSPMGTLLNGQRIQQALLAHGSVIQIGSFSLQFLMKNQPAPAFGPEHFGQRVFPVGQPGVTPQLAPMPANPYLGQPQGQAFTGNPQMGMPTQMMPLPQQAPSMPTQAFVPTPSQPTMAYPSAFGTTLSVLAVDGPMIGQRFAVTGLLEVGREAIGVRLNNDVNASRRHAALSPSAGGIGVQDLGSTNGTFVNGQRVSQATAVQGDLIKIGSTTFRVEPA